MVARQILNADGEVGAWDLSILAGNYGTEVDPVTGELLQTNPGFAAAPTGDTNGDGVVDEQDLSTVLGSFGQSTDPSFAPVEGVLTEAEASAIEGAFEQAMPQGLDCVWCAKCDKGWCQVLPGDEMEDDTDLYDQVGGDEDDDGSPGSDNPPDPGDGGPDADEDGDGTPNKDDCDSARAGTNASCDCADVTVRTNILGDTDMDGDILHDADEERRLDHDSNAQTPEREFEKLGAPGLIVLVNDDDDDEDGAPDREQTSALQHFTVDDELVLVHLQITPNREDMGKWKLTYNPDVFRIWTTRSREALIESGVEDFLPVPFTVFVEALAPTGIGTESIRLDFIPDPAACTGDLGGSFAGQEAKFNDTIRLTAVRLEMFDLRHWGPGYNSGAKQPFIQNLNLDATGMPVGGAITDGASICLLRLTPPLSEHVKDNFDEDGDGTSEEYWEVIRPDYPHGGIEIDAKARIGSTQDPDVVGSLHPVKRPVDPDGPGPLPRDSWNSLTPPNTLPQLPLIESDDESARPTQDVQSNDGLWFYVPPEGFRDDDGLDPNPGLVVKATVRLEVRINGQGRGDFEFILRRPPIVLVHGLWSSPATWPPDLWSKDPTTISPGLATTIFRLDYESSHAMGYDINMRKIPEYLQVVLGHYRSGTVPGDATQRRVAATRVDTVGHSMGGVLTRLFISDAATQNLDRKSGHDPINLLRGSTNHYLRHNNWGAGDIRRFISIGAPFDGSNLANSMEKAEKAVEKATFYGEVLQNFGAFLQMANDQINGVAPTGLTVGGPDHPWWNFPDAIIDLQPGSAMQELADRSIYPVGRRRVPWHPIVGRVAVPLSSKQKEDILGWGLFQVPNLAASAVLGFNPGLNELNPMNGDLVVTASSQRNGNPETVGTVLTQTLHADHSDPRILALIAELNLVTETGSAAIVNRVRDLLNSRTTSGDWDGDLTQ